MSSSGTMRPTGMPEGLASCSTKCVSCLMRSDSGCPPRLMLDTFDHLLAQTIVLVGAARLRREGEDRLLVGGALLEADALADRRVEDAVAEDLANGLLNVT